jgi:hypothetical protein
VRTAFHDAVARFGESARPRTGVLFPSSADAAPPLTLLSLGVRRHPLFREKTLIPQSQDRFIIQRVNAWTTTPARRAFVPCASPITRRRRNDATQHVIRSHLRTLVSSPRSIRLGAGPRCPVLLSLRSFRRACNARFVGHGSKAPSPNAGVHLRTIDGQRRSCERRTTVPEGPFSCAGRERTGRRVAEQPFSRNGRDWQEPRPVVSRAPHVTAPKPAMCRNTRLRSIGGPRFTRSAPGHTLRHAAASVTRPAKGAILAWIEVLSVHPGCSQVKGSLPFVRLIGLRLWIDCALRHFCGGPTPLLPWIDPQPFATGRGATLGSIVGLRGSMNLTRRRSLVPALEKWGAPLSRGSRTQRHG